MAAFGRLHAECRRGSLLSRRDASSAPPRGARRVASHASPAGAQPLPRVFPACDLADFDDPLEASVLPAFESADLLGLPLLFAMMLTSLLCRVQPQIPGTSDTRSKGQVGKKRRGGAVDPPVQTPLRGAPLAHDASAAHPKSGEWPGRRRRKDVVVTCSFSRPTCHNSRIFCRRCEADCGHGGFSDVDGFRCTTCRAAVR